MTDSVVVEGHVKLRDGKKWKSRWLVLRKPSPVAVLLLLDCLLMLVYKDKSERAKGHKERSSMTLEDICGLDPGLSYEGLNHTLAIICLSQVVMLGFENKETMFAWDVRIRYSLGEGAGVFFLSCAEGEQISFLFDCIVRGISPTKGPFGLRPVLPDPSTNPAYSEERLAHEALQLEKRLSLLSHTSRQGSGGDDRSLSSSSSDTSHSDVSVGSRLTIWPEQSSASTSQESHGLAAAKGIHLGEEKTLPEGARGTTKPPPKPLRSRQLQEIGRQSSSDSGIATGSHSSYSGSFSSYAGSLDICHGDEFGSLLSLPLNFPSDQNLCTCPHSEPQRGAGSEYQVPSSLRHIYDIPRSLLQAPSKDVQPKNADSTLPKDQALSPQGASDPKLLLPHLEARRVPEHSQDRGRPSSLLAESTKDSSDETYVDFVSRWSDAKPQGQVSDSKSSELSPPSGASADPCDTCSPHLGMTRALFSACPICGGLKGTAILQSGVLPAIPGGASVMAASGSLKVHRGHSLQAGPKGGYEMLTLPAEPGTPTSPEEPEGAVGYSADVPASDRPHSETTTYVNIPVSPTSKKQLHYMELELQEPSTSIRGSGSSRYAQIDIAATETAHKVGTQHAQCREERLQELEQKKKGAQQ
ncbi:protein Dok-7 isoform X3 [Rissa tridactyla]|uniref:protein Dok-7 isoform X3 n=1 Tax=Rissa tridactyla TaxID=75485 RepID=UPI0023BA67A8|nr:protein Dok-7 isoform X3 [Rissa tridactyla]